MSVSSIWDHLAGDDARLPDVRFSILFVTGVPELQKQLAECL